MITIVVGLDGHKIVAHFFDYIYINNILTNFFLYYLYDTTLKSKHHIYFLNLQSERTRLEHRRIFINNKI